MKKPKLHRDVLYVVKCPEGRFALCYSGRRGGWHIFGDDGRLSTDRGGFVRVTTRKLAERVVGPVTIEQAEEIGIAN